MYIMIKNYKFWMFCVLSMFLLCLVSQEAAAITIGDMAKSLKGTFDNIGLAITGGSYVAGLAFSIGAIMKFKAHKDNPTQVTVGQPISLVFIAAALLFLPSILSVTGFTMFGEQGTTSGPTGSTITGS